MWLFTFSLCSLISLTVDKTVSCCFGMKLYALSSSISTSNLLFKSRILAVSDSNSVGISIRMLGRNSFDQRSLRLSKVKLVVISLTTLQSKRCSRFLRAQPFPKAGASSLLFSHIDYTRTRTLRPCFVTPNKIRIKFIFHSHSVVDYLN